MYKGRLIIITNKKIYRVQDESPTIARARLDPVMSRVQYIAAGLPNNRFKVEAIRMFHEGYKNHPRYHLRCFHNVPSDVQEQIVHWIDQNKDKMVEISFRAVANIVNLWRQRPEPEHWKRMAKRSQLAQYPND